MSDDKKLVTITITVDGKEHQYWFDQETYDMEMKLSKIRQELMDMHIFLGVDIKDPAVISKVYERHGLTYVAPNPFKLDFYWIITDRGLMAKDRKTGDVYAVKSSYEPEDKPFEGEYKYIRDARGMDL